MILVCGDLYRARIDYFFFLGIGKTSPDEHKNAQTNQNNTKSSFHVGDFK